MLLDGRIDIVREEMQYIYDRIAQNCQNINWTPHLQIRLADLCTKSPVLKLALPQDIDESYASVFCTMWQKILSKVPIDRV